MLEAGAVLQERYRIVKPLGQGGMGAVYRAWDIRLRVPVAIKEMRAQPDLDARTLSGLLDQFHKEAMTLARLNHPNLVQVTDFFQDKLGVFLVMDFVEGESLAKLIEKQGALPEARVLEWAFQLLDALSYCHAQGVIHRDIKPQNIIIRPDGRAVLVDFGLVKLWDPSDPKTRTTMRGLGTPEYAPPEQYDEGAGSHTTPISDVYSLGATLYHCLTGQAPPTATSRVVDPARMKPIHMMAPTISANTEQVIAKATELVGALRYRTVAEMAAALGSAPTTQVITPSQPAPIYSETVALPGEVPGGGPPRISQPMTGQSISQPIPGRISQPIPGRISQPIAGHISQPITPFEPEAAIPPYPTVKPRRKRFPLWLLAIPVIVILGAWFVGRFLAGDEENPLVAVLPDTATATQLPPSATPTVQPDTPTPTLDYGATSTAIAQRATATAEAETHATATTEARETAQARATATAAYDYPAIYANASRWTQVVFEKFDDNLYDWATGDVTTDLVDGTRIIEGGVYRWDATALGGVVWYSRPEAPAVSDFFLRVVGYITKDSDLAAWGLIFRNPDASNYYYFEIDEYQQYEFLVLQDSTWTTLLGPSVSEAIKPQRANEIAIVAEGSRFIFYINEQFVGEYTDNTFAEGKTAIAIDLDQGMSATFGFSEFELRSK